MLFVPPSMPFMVPEAEADTPPVVTMEGDIEHTVAANTVEHQIDFLASWSHPGGGVSWSCESEHGVSASSYQNGKAYPHYVRVLNGINVPIGTTTITCSATDSAGNTGTGTFTATVVLSDSLGTTPPVFWTTENITRQATNSTGYNVSFTPGAVDDIDSNNDGSLDRIYLHWESFLNDRPAGMQLTCSPKLQIRLPEGPNF